MKLNDYLYALLGGALVVSAAQSNADNCARAAAGTLGGQRSSRLAACSSFQHCTVTPAQSTTLSISTIIIPGLGPTVQPILVTSTETVLLTTTVTAGASKIKRDGLGRRQQTAAAVTSCPTAVPASASACSASSRYASACSCAGITKTFTTLPTPPVVTETVIITLPPPFGDQPGEVITVTETTTSVVTQVVMSRA